MLLSKKTNSNLKRNLEIIDTIFSPIDTKHPEKTIEELYPGKSDEEIWDIIFKKEINNEELTNIESDFNLNMIFYHEFMKARSLAIHQLVNNIYDSYDDESGNRFKELINFTLKYFENYIFDKPTEVPILLVNQFPIMHSYIYRQIYKQQNTIETDDYFDEQKAFDEFLVFCKNYFCLRHPDKIQRDEQIKQHFKLSHNDLIYFIDEAIA